MKNDNELQNSAQESAAQSQMTIGQVPMSTDSTAGDEPSTAEENAAEQLPTNETTAEEAESAPTAASAPGRNATDHSDGCATHGDDTARNERPERGNTHDGKASAQRQRLSAGGVEWPVVVHQIRLSQMALHALASGALCLAFVGYRIKRCISTATGCLPSKNKPSIPHPRRFVRCATSDNGNFFRSTRKIGGKHESSLLPPRNNWCASTAAPCASAST